jgi:glucose dehydrogenase
MMGRFALQRSVGVTIVAGLALVGIALAGALQSGSAQGQALVRGNVPGEWRYWGADAWSSRYSALDQINASNFDKLRVAWEWPAGAFGADEYYRTRSHGSSSASTAGYASCCASRRRRS